MSLHLNIPWDYVLQAVLSFFKLLFGWLSQLSQQAGAHLGVWGQLGLHLFLVIIFIWLIYQFLRAIAFIMFRIVLPLAIVAFSLFILAVLTS